MRIGELAARSGFSRDTLRFYEKRGLIRSIRRPNGYRHYADQTLVLLEFIGTARSLGFTLAEIESELPELVETGLSRERTADLLHSKLALIDRKIDDLSRLRSRIESLLAQACPLAVPDPSR